MALSAELENLLGELAKVDAKAAQEQRAIFEKFPSLHKPMQEGVMRQSDYDRKMNEVKPKVERYDEVLKWYEDTKPQFDERGRRIQQLTTDLEKERTDRAADKTKFEREIQEKTAAALAAAGGDPKNAEAIAENVRKAMSGYMTQAEISKLIQDEVKKGVAEGIQTASKTFYETEVPATLQLAAGVTKAQQDYLAETGKPLDTAEFAKLVKANGGDTVKAYAAYVDPFRRQKEITDGVAKGIEEWKKNNPQAEGIPGTSGGGGRGVVQERIATRKPEDPLFGKDFELGDNTAAMAAAAEIRAEGKL